MNTSIFPTNGRKRFFDRPAASQSFVDCVFAQAETASPFTQTKPLSVEFQDGRYFSVASVLHWGSPPTVVRFVIAIVVNSIQLTSVRSWSHILKERFKRIKPCGADADASPAISGVTLRSRIATSILHRIPSPVFLGVGHTVPSCSGTNRLTAKTATTLRRSRCQMTGSYCGDQSTIALSSPVMTARSRLVTVANNGQKAIAQPSLIVQWRGHVRRSFLSNPLYRFDPLRSMITTCQRVTVALTFVAT